MQEITPENSIVPIYLDPIPEEIVAADIADVAARASAKEEQIVKRLTAISKLEALGLDEDDLKALGLGGN